MQVVHSVQLQSVMKQTACMRHAPKKVRQEAKHLEMPVQLGEVDSAAPELAQAAHHVVAAPPESLEQEPLVENLVEEDHWQKEDRAGGRPGTSHMQQELRTPPWAHT